MNCDQVFDVLTRGPFPTGTDCDEPVEAHLSQCAECHRLAEALRPAVELFQEAVDPEESRDLPGYWSTAAADQQAVLSYAPQVETHHDALPGATRELAGAQTALVAWRMAAMLAVGVTLGLLLSARSVMDGFDWSPFGSGAAPQQPAPAADAWQQSLADRLHLAALPAACLTGEHKTLTTHDAHLVPGAPANVACCSGCHHAAAEPAVPAAATIRVAASCQVCHVERPKWRFESR